MASTSTYEGKGRYEMIGALKCYVTGNESSDVAILEVYDAFGFVAPVFKGADRLAEIMNAFVVLPDFFHDNPAQLSWITRDGKIIEETKNLYNKFLTEKAMSPDNFTAVLSAVHNAKLRWPSVRAWGGLGLGWGGKLIAKASSTETPFKASGQAFPSRPAREDAEKFTIPHICLASRTDNPEEIRAYAQVLSRDEHIGEVETYASMYHGWMGARCVLDDAETIKEFERGYQQLARFFTSTLN